MKETLGEAVEVTIWIAVLVGIAIGFATILTKPILDNMTENMFERETSEDIYNPKNSTIDQAYANCLEKIEELNYSVYSAEFEKAVWADSKNFSTFLGWVRDYNITAIFTDSPKLRGRWFWVPITPMQAYVWFNHELNGDTVTMYYELTK